MQSRVTRRSAAAALAGPLLLVAQTAPAPSPAASNPDLSSARERLRANSEALAKIDVPMQTEPAVHFKA